MIYTMLDPTQKVLVECGNLSLRTLPHWLHQQPYLEGWWDAHPHYWDRSYVGDATYMELQEHYFRWTIFRFDGDSEEVAMFHAMSQYHQRVGYMPKHSLTHLEIAFYCDEYGLHPKGRFTPPEYLDLFGPSCRAGVSDGSPADLQSDLQHIAGFAPATKIEIHVKECRSSLRYELVDLRDAVEKIQPLLHPITQSAEMKGLVVRVFFQIYSEEYTEHFFKLEGTLSPDKSSQALAGVSCTHLPLQDASLTSTVLG